MMRNLLLATVPLLQPLEDRVLLADTVIDVWYGDYQEFGQLGNPQRCINILGNVSDGDGMSSLKYSLNGAAWQSLTIGPDTRRLAKAGDFNVEIDRTRLLEGNNTVELRAQDKKGYVTYHNVDVHYTGSSEWPIPYQVVWSEQSDFTAATQVVDGLWGVQNGMLRTLIPGYDRVVAFGSTDWQDYEITVPFVAHAKGGGIGIVMRWQGHTAVDDKQPAWAWWPSGATAWFYWPNTTGQLKIEGANGDLVKKSVTVNPGENFTLKFRCETQSANQSLYKLKMWRSDLPEPSQWTLTAYDLPADLEYGSVLLVAHETDVSFDNVTITGEYARGDLNYDGSVNAADIDLLYANLGGGAQYDLTGDGAATQADVDELVGGILQTHYGDANLDQTVDFTDFQMLLDNWQASTGWAGGDFTGDGMCDFIDFQLVLDNWSETSALSAPAPSVDAAEALTATTPAAATMAPAADLNSGIAALLPSILPVVTTTAYSPGAWTSAKTSSSSTQLLQATAGPTVSQQRNPSSPIPRKDAHRRVELWDHLREGTPADLLAGLPRVLVR